MDSAYERVCQRLAQVTGGTGRGGTWPCPAHDDSTPSLSVAQGDQGVLLTCHAGCDTEAITRALDLTMADLFDAKRNGQERRVEDARYPYHDEHGAHLFDVIRFYPKDFRQQAADGSWTTRNVRKVPYRLPELLTAVADGDTVFVTEGEKDVHALVRAGYTATTNPGGAGKWRPDYNVHFRDATVVVIADNDAPGKAHARQVAEQLETVAAQVTLTCPAEGKDLSDHMAAGLSPEDLLVLDDDELDAEPEHPVDPTAEPPPDHQDPDEPTSFVDRLAAAIITTQAIKELPAPSWLVDGYLVRDSLALLYGPSGTYKTFLGIDLALHVATGSWWHKHAIDTAGRVLYVIAEGVAGVGARINAWQTHRRLYDLDQHQPVSWLPRAVNLADKLETAAFAEVAHRLTPDLIVLDTLARCTLGAEENSARDMGMVVESLDHIRRTTAACVLTIHHTGKEAASGARGSSAVRAAMDTELEINADPLELRVTKQKDAPEPPRLQFTPIPVEPSLVLEPTSIIAQGDEIGANDALVLAALQDVQVPGGVPSGTWEKAASVAPRTFYRARARLVAKGLVLTEGSEARPRYTPAEGPSATVDPPDPG
jgi:hypothetical protein